MAALTMFEDALVLLAEQNSFCSSYVADVVKQAGARIVGPFGDEDSITAWLGSATEPPAIALLSAELQEAQLNLLVAQLELLAVPYLFISETASARPFVEAAFTWPFAGFQVAEALKSKLDARPHQGPLQRQPKPS